MTTKTITNTYGDGRTEEKLLLTADEGKALTNDGGVTLWNCVAVDSADGWIEVDAPAADEEISAEEALGIITGGAV
nr:MAG TPA: hypothetical protein [Caudoviricetes sp.]